MISESTVRLDQVEAAIDAVDGKDTGTARKLVGGMMARTRGALRFEAGDERRKRATSVALALVALRHGMPDNARHWLAKLRDELWDDEVQARADEISGRKPRPDPETEPEGFAAHCRDAAHDAHEAIRVAMAADARTRFDLARPRGKL